MLRRRHPELARDQALSLRFHLDAAAVVGNGDDGNAAWLQQAPNLSHQRARVDDMLQHILQAADVVALAAGYHPIENGERISRLDAVRQARVEPPQAKIREVDSFDAVAGILCHLQQEPFAASYLKEITFRRVAGRDLRNG